MATAMFEARTKAAVPNWSKEEEMGRVVDDRERTVSDTVEE